MPPRTRWLACASAVTLCIDLKPEYSAFGPLGVNRHGIRSCSKFCVDDRYVFHLLMFASGVTEKPNRHAHGSGMTGRWVAAERQTNGPVHGPQYASGKHRLGKVGAGV